MARFGLPTPAPPSALVATPQNTEFLKDRVMYKNTFELEMEKGIAAGHQLGLNRILGGDAEQTLALPLKASGDSHTGRELLETAKANIDAKVFPLIRFRFEAFENLLLLKQGKPAGPLAWVERSQLHMGDGVTLFKEIPLMVVARVLYRTKHYEQAHELLLESV